MIQSVNPAPTDETDGLPMPRRIWAVISVGFALCIYNHRTTKTNQKYPSVNL